MQIFSFPAFKIRGFSALLCFLSYINNMYLTLGLTKQNVRHQLRLWETGLDIFLSKWLNKGNIYSNTWTRNNLNAYSVVGVKLNTSVQVWNHMLRFSWQIWILQYTSAHLKQNEWGEHISGLQCVGGQLHFPHIWWTFNVIFFSPFIFGFNKRFHMSLIYLIIIAN